ncbi:hypothetical protein [Salinibacter ruber]|uniref:hypothetical protein n=1 Tax=Salinibacter ruber TaxID=146919 RepID=UPI002167AB9F|nr:hypothetical protein [Salinibacter ruber]MCS4136406.1 preprotein translocase subunit SecG [Salinibacter ruber]
MKISLRIAFSLATAILLIPGVALAYGGPGSVISGIGAFLAAVAALLASLFGFIWFPLKRLYRRITEEEASEKEAASGQKGE